MDGRPVCGRLVPFSGAVFPSEVSLEKTISFRYQAFRWLAMAAMVLPALLPVRASADESLWSLGLRTQDALDFKTGHDFFTGPELGYSNYDLTGHRFQIKAAYLTSRMEQTFRENILKYDFFLLTPLWHFRRDKLFDPTVQVDLGYARFDVENEDIFGDLDNDTWVATFQPGINFNFGQGRYGFQYTVGYNFITPEGHLLYPGTFGLNLWMFL